MLVRLFEIIEDDDGDLMSIREQCSCNHYADSVDVLSFYFLSATLLVWMLLSILTLMPMPGKMILHPPKGRQRQ